MNAAQRPSPSGSEARVLVVDDSPANLIAMGAVLKPLHIEVVEAKTGTEALEHVAREAFAVALLDVQMPDMDGFELAKRIRQVGSGAELPIVFLTAIHRDELYVRHGYQAGGADYITKPFDADILRARVKAFVDLFQQRERLRMRQVGERTRERDAALEQLAALLESERAARREAELANRAKDEFLATVSHELRTPLNAILGWSVLARDMTNLTQIQRALGTIERNARAQMRIIEDVLDISRIISGKLRLEIAPSRIAEAVDGAVEAVRAAADAKDVKLDVQVDADLGTVPADMERLQQVVWNLMSNAIKFTPNGGRVTVHAYRHDAEALIEVTDTGQGITGEFLPFLFDAFRQADGSTTRRHGGLGLGLAIVKQLVQAHGGTVTAKSDGIGKGATFTVQLPVRGASTSRPPPPHESDQGVRLDGVHLLVVDDDEDARNLLHHALSQYGANVITASGAEDALVEMTKRLPDMILSDIAMPNVDGFEFMRRVRSLQPELGGKTPAIAVTANAQDDFATTSRAAGFQGHVPKPIDPANLASVVASTLRESRA